MPGIIKDIPSKFHRLYKQPLDDSTVVSGGNAGLFSYINTGTAYLGQRVLVRYDHFDLNVTLMQGADTSKLVPVFEMPSGYELMYKSYNGGKYILVYYYNGGSLFTSKEEAYRVSDPFAMSLLYQASLFACSDSNITYLLEDGNLSYSFTQANFTKNNVPMNNGTSVGVISSTANSRFFFPTANNNIGIMPKIAGTKKIKLWVRADNYYDAVVGL